MEVMVGPFGPSLWVLWLNGIVDYPLKRVLTLGLVSGDHNGWPLGLLAPFPSWMLWWPLLQLWDTHLRSWPLHTPSWPFSPWALSLPNLLSLEEGILHTKSFPCFEERVEGFYNILGVRRGIMPFLHPDSAFCSDWFAYLSMFWHLGYKYPYVAYHSLDFIIIFF